MRQVQELDLPPAGSEYKQVMEDPFARRDIPAGAVISYPHTRDDEAFSREMSLAASLDELEDRVNIPESELQGLARHQPLAGGRHINSYGTNVAPTITMPDTHADKVASAAADRVSDARWHEFAQPRRHDTPEQRKHRRIGWRVLGGRRP